MNQPVPSHTTVSIEHMRIESETSLENVKAALERIVPQLDPAVTVFLRKGDREHVDWQREHGPKLSLFVTRDHGSLLKASGEVRKAFQYEIGNPITASLMTRHDTRAALYAPLRIILYEDDQGHAIIEYDKPSSLFGQFRDERVTEVARELDNELEDILLRAAA